MAVSSVLIVGNHYHPRFSSSSISLVSFDPFFPLPFLDGRLLPTHGPHPPQPPHVPDEEEEKEEEEDVGVDQLNSFPPVVRP